MGIFPNLFADGQFPKDAASLNHFLRQITPNTGAYDLDVVSDAVAAVFDRIGEGVLITHSQSLLTRRRPRLADRAEKS